MPGDDLFEAAQVRGVLRALDDPERKARVLQRLMEHLQPEGGYVPITATHPHYRAPVKGLLIGAVSLEQLTVKRKLAQNKRPEERTRLLESLWARGAPGDARAIELIRAANPDTPTPAFLAGPGGARLFVDLDGPQRAEVQSSLHLAEAGSAGVWVAARTDAGWVAAAYAQAGEVEVAGADAALRGRLRSLLEVHPALRGRGHQA